MAKALHLRNVNHMFFKMDKNRKYCVYTDPTGNVIVFSPYDNCTVDSVCNSIAEDMYGYLCNELNTHKNLLVHWSQVEGTTSDYTIYYDMPIGELIQKSYKDIMEYLEQNRIDSEYWHFKYLSVKDGLVTRILRSELT